MPLKKTSEHLVDKDWRYFYKYSLGCIGSLKNWFMDAYSFALERQSKTLTKEHLEVTRISGRRSSGMLESILEGEKKMTNIKSEGNIDAKLGFSKLKSSSPSNSEDNSLKIRPKPFDRKPKRDHIMNK